MANKIHYEEESLERVSQEEVIKECPDCGSKEFELRSEERFCKKCGLILE